ncbi:serine-threonine/tyrosine-protein kinase catalytic domain-containing protein [Tanacetum coccineum]
MDDEDLSLGLKEFLTEIQLLFGQEHPNLISLLGYCDEGKEKIIFYEYAARGSLDRYIRRRNRDESFTTLTWLERLKICVDGARGLDHLHNHIGGHRTIIHKDIKSSNILIDENWVAKISDLSVLEFSSALSSYHVDEKAAEQIISKLTSYAIGMVERKARDEAARVLFYVKERYMFMFNHDINSRIRVWTHNEDIQAIRKIARSSVRISCVYYGMMMFGVGPIYYSLTRGSYIMLVFKVAFGASCNTFK